MFYGIMLDCRMKFYALFFLFIKFFGKSFQFPWFFLNTFQAFRVKKPSILKMCDFWRKSSLWENPCRPVHIGTMKIFHTCRYLENISYISGFEKYFMRLGIWKIYHAPRDLKNISCISLFEKYFMQLEIWKTFYTSWNFKSISLIPDLYRVYAKALVIQMLKLWTYDVSGQAISEESFKVLYQNG